MPRKKSRHNFSVIGDGSFVPLFGGFVYFASLGELRVLHTRNFMVYYSMLDFFREIHASNVSTFPFRYRMKEMSSLTQIGVLSGRNKAEMFGWRFHILLRIRNVSWQYGKLLRGN